MKRTSPPSPPAPASGPSVSPQFREHLDRVRHCMQIAVTHLTTIQALIPTDDELRTASTSRAHVDPDELVRQRAQLELAMHEMCKLARVVIDQSRACAGLDPQCCDWPSLEEMKTGEC